ncbi:MAG: CPBP family intramembrane metalloprotease, partial [Candidatus Bipolaricaulota bacterium]|nr:CPBP family intramembrane metalloprotease [Candidatus Bipolaricaulota bacterium]
KDFPKETTIGVSLFLAFEAVRLLVFAVQGRVLMSISVDPSRVLDAAGQALPCAFEEEVFYRGLVISFLLSQFQRWDLVALISSLIFALAHLHLGLSPLGLLNLTGSGVIYALLYIWRGYNLTVPIVVHTLQNFVAILRS